MGKCPMCDGELKATELLCKDCSIKISGEFEMNRLFSLSEDELEFVVTFIKSRGNTKKVQEELDISSYYTVRNKLSKILESLGLENEE